MNSIKRDYGKYVSLNILSMIGLSLYVLADTFFIANGVGESGLAALNLVLPIYSIISATGLMLAMGGATLFSIFKGSASHEKANSIFTSTLILGIFIGLFYTIIGIVFSEHFSLLLGANSDTLELAKTYIQTICSFSIAFIINNIFTAFMRNDNAPQLAMASMLLGSLFNIVFDYIFIFPLQMGMFGAALATGFSPIVGILLATIHLRSKNKGFSLVRQRPSLKLLIKSLSLGIPSFITEFSSGIIIICFNFTVLKFSGNTGVAAYGIITNIALVATAIFTGLGQGIQPLISTYYGAQNNTAIKTTLKYTIVTAFSIGTLLYIASLVFTKPIINAFNHTSNFELEALATDGIQLYFSAFIIMGINIALTSYLSSRAMPRQSFIISILRGSALIIPLLLLLSHFWQMNGVWLTVPITEFLTLLLSLTFLKQSFAKDKSI